MTEHTNLHGSARVKFSCMGSPIIGFRYRLRLASGKVYKGSSDPSGYSKTVKLGANSQLSDANYAAWLVPDETAGTSIAIEVRRDDGSWKSIGEFLLEAYRQKEVSAEANAVALPFHMARVAASN